MMYTSGNNNIQAKRLPVIHIKTRKSSSPFFFSSIADAAAAAAVITHLVRIVCCSLSPI